jgi:aminotransferase in exopolysaccharide biosynthesis
VIIVVNEELVFKVIQSIRNVIGPGAKSLHSPIFSGNEFKYLKDCIDSTYVSSVGSYVDCFENELAKFTGSKYVVAVVNSTAALHISLKLSDILPNDEVLVPTLTFIATANAVSYCGAVPHFIDCEIDGVGLDIEKLRKYLMTHTTQINGCNVNKKTGRNIKALIAMHTFGHPVDLNALMQLCKEFNISLIEDAAESLGSYYFGKHTGTFGDFGVLSFNGNKIITTGGGGAILTQNYEVAQLAKHLTTTAKLKHDWDYRHDQIGYNYRMPNLNAALGCAQLETLSDSIKSKRSLYDAYQKEFQDLEGVKLIREPAGCESNYWLQTIILMPELSYCRDLILEKTNSLGIMTRPSWVPMHMLEPYKNCPSMDLSNSESLVKRLINIPSSAFMNLNYA